MKRILLIINTFVLVLLLWKGFIDPKIVSGIIWEEVYEASQAEAFNAKALATHLNITEDISGDTDNNHLVSEFRWRLHDPVAKRMDTFTCISVLAIAVNIVFIAVFWKKKEVQQSH